MADNRGSLMSGCLKVLGVLMLMALAAAGAVWGFSLYMKKLVLDPDPVTIASASLQGLREQNRLNTFSARYVAVVTSKQTKLGLSAQKTIIMPGSVRYEVDLGRVGPNDVRWDASGKKLSVKLPPIEIVGPQVDLEHTREYGEGGILMRISDAEARLDAANRKAAQVELVRQAREETPMRLAREATRRAVERNFALPLKAAGVDANVEVWFPGEKPGEASEQWDRSRSLEQVYGNRQ